MPTNSLTLGGTLGRIPNSSKMTSSKNIPFDKNGSWFGFYFLFKGVVYVSILLLSAS
jgi:hypothetical protein